MDYDAAGICRAYYYNLRAYSSLLPFMKFFTVLSNPQRPAFHLIWIGWYVGALLDLIDSLVTILSGAILSTSFGANFRFFMLGMQVRDFDRKRLAEMKADDKPQPIIEE
jgi:hypothetical protein